MKSKIRISSAVLLLIIVLCYFTIYLLGFRPIASIEKCIIIACIIVGIINVGLFMLKVIRENKVIYAIISFQLAIVGVFMCCILLKNFNTNMYMVNKNNNNFMMKINVNDNSKEYYLCKNKYIIYRECAIKEFLKETTLSYEENIPVKVMYNKKLITSGIDKEIIENQKKIISSKLVENVDSRIVEMIDSFNELNEFCTNYEIENTYNENFFENSSIIVVSYIPFREVIPYVAQGEDNNIYLYVKEEDDNDFINKSFCFIEYEKRENIKEIIVENYDNTMKNNRI